MSICFCKIILQRYSFCDSIKKKRGDILKNRIKELRKSLNLNQTEFGEKIGVKQGSVASYESGARMPLDAVINSICREFNVNEEWLRNGTGKMFIEMNRQQRLANMTAMLFKEEENSFKNRLFAALSELDENEWELLEKIAEKTVHKKD